MLPAGVLFLAAIMSHRPVLLSAALLFLIAGTLSRTVVEALRGWMLWNLGAWMGLDGRRHTRLERPGAFRAWLVAHFVVAAVLAGVTVYLARFELGRIASQVAS